MPKPTRQASQPPKPAAGDPELHPLAVRLVIWSFIREQYEWTVPAKDKWGAVLCGRTDLVVEAAERPILSDHHKVPKQAREAAEWWQQFQREAGLSDGLTSAPGKVPPVAASRAALLRQRHEQKCQQAVLLLTTRRFVDDIIAAAKRWGLFTAYYHLDYGDLPTHEPNALWCWETHLIAESVTYLSGLTDPQQQASAQSVLRYLDDRNLDALDLAARELASALPIRRFRCDVQDLTRRYGLSALWERSIEGLLLSGHLYVPYFDCRAVLQWRRDQPRVFIEVFPETAKEDVAEQWPRVEFLLAHVFPGRRRRRRMERSGMDEDLAVAWKVDEGRGLDEVVVNDYDFDDTGKETEKLEELRAALKRARRSQRRARKSAHGALPPDALKWLRTFTWTDEQEWQQ